jgi:hypothetical protein
MLTDIAAKNAKPAAKPSKPTGSYFLVTLPGGKPWRMTTRSFVAVAGQWFEKWGTEVTDSTADSRWNRSGSISCQAASRIGN